MFPPSRKKTEDKERDQSKKKKTEDKEENVSQILGQLKEKHKEGYTNFQLRNWSEMIVGSVYSSLEIAPNTSMFLRAGGGTKRKKPVIFQMQSLKYLPLFCL